MATIPFDTLDAANTRSRELWEAILGRPKHEQDVTRYLYGRTVEVDEETGEPTGNVYMDIPQRDAYLDTLLRADQMAAEEIAEIVNLYPAWASGTAYSVGDLVAYDNRLYKVVQAHTSQATWQPPNVPALFVDTAPAGTIPEWVAPTGAHNAYNLGDLVTYQGQVWRSTIADNVWPPGVFGWVVN